MAQLGISPRQPTRGVEMTINKEDLEREIQKLEENLAALQKERKEAEKRLKYTAYANNPDYDRNPNPEQVVQRHIMLLHEYNEIRDVALNFAGTIAEKEQCPVIDVLKEFGMEGKD